ncbi:MAG: hypothetical protein CVV17_06110, partial [Gammaproteobacteria bacterium HGW-Gammaproteobacteria-7]
MPADAPLFEELPHEEDNEPAAEQASGEPLLIASSEQEWPRVRVNGVAIASQAIAQELQYHPAESREEAVYLATQALVLRELLQQRIGELGLVVQATAGESEEEAATALAGCLAETGGAVDATVVDAVEGDTLPPSDAVTGDTLASSDTVTLDTEGPIDTSPLADTAAVDGADTGPPAGTCAARCGTFSVGESCQCDAPCVQYGNCCADYEALCATGPAATDFLVAQGDDCADAADWIAVTHVRDGDTVDVASGDAVRFLLVDTPELSSDDCVAWDARAFT